MSTRIVLTGGAVPMILAPQIDVDVTGDGDIALEIMPTYRRVSSALGDTDGVVVADGRLPARIAYAQVPAQCDTCMTPEAARALAAALVHYADELDAGRAR